MRRPDLGGDENIFALNSRRPQALADLGLVVVHLRRIDVAITEPQRLLGHARACASAQVPGPEPERWDARSVRLEDRHRHANAHRLFSSQPPMSSANPCRKIARRAVSRLAQLAIIGFAIVP